MPDDQEPELLHNKTHNVSVEDSYVTAEPYKILATMFTYAAELKHSSSDIVRAPGPDSDKI